MSAVDKVFKLGVLSCLLAITVAIWWVVVLGRSDRSVDYELDLIRAWELKQNGALVGKDEQLEKWIRMLAEQHGIVINEPEPEGWPPKVGDPYP
jgi:hypothetical protein